LSIVGRIFLIFLAALVAGIAAGMVIVTAVLTPEWSDLVLGPLDESTFGVMVTFGAIFVSGFALLPALVVIAVAEVFRIRTVLYYAFAGAAVAALLDLSFRNFDTLALSVNGFARRELEIMTAAGIIAGFVYWLIVGRSAGNWGERPASPPVVR
jgi:hypothetical protein